MPDRWYFFLKKKDLKFAVDFSDERSLVKILGAALYPKSLLTPDWVSQSIRNALKLHESLRKTELELKNTGLDFQRLKNWPK
jgi:hypothetical protein